MAITESPLAPVNQQGLDVRSTPREEMELFPLDTFAYEFPGREINIDFEITEFTAICPFSDFPDFATLRLMYVPGERCVELKSLKLYIWSFRNEGAFHEAVTNRILGDLAKATRPRFMRLTARFYVRGGIFTTVVAQHVKRGWKVEALPELDEAPAPGSRSVR